MEIKGSVFKKFEKNNLFQMSNSGERGHPAPCLKLAFELANLVKDTFMKWSGVTGRGK